MADEHGPSDLNKEDPLESLLDDETDEEFGLPRFQEHFADSLNPAVLKDWSAKDFASIYVRFRPHLERHAKRFLVNPSQVEEVVQDAFLYLMTTLPELDSELGVLKFLKWKTRLLALDVIRANSRVSIAPLHEQREFEADIPEMGQELERADDAAIVSLALAKLQPRHREALLATLYEEKSAEIVSAQMGLSENAFRQLLFRSRAAFKKALIGEAEISGLSMSEVLSVAARKAAAESGKLASVAGAFLLVLALSFGVIPNLTSNVPEDIVSQPQPISQDSKAAEPPPPQALEGALPVEQGFAFEPAALEPKAGAATAGEEAVEQSREPGNAGSLNAAGAAQSKTAGGLESDSEVIELADPRTARTTQLRNTLSGNAAAGLARLDGSTVVAVQSGSAGTISVTSGTGVTANVSFDLESKTGIKSVWFKLSVEGEDFISAPKSWLAQKIANSDGTFRLDYVATDLVIGDALGKYDFVAVEDSEVSRIAIQLSLVLDSEGYVTGSTFAITARSSAS